MYTLASFYTSFQSAIPYTSLQHSASPDLVFAIQNEKPTSNGKVK
jgi:hypothetical protein